VFKTIKIKNMTTLENTIETVKIGKYIFTIEKRANTQHLPNHPFRVVFEQATPKAKIFKTKLLKNLAFKTVEDCEKWIEEKYRNIYLNLKADAKRKAEKREAQKLVNASDFYAAGDIVYSSWGYEQTNVDFFQVVKMTKKTITVKPIAGARVEGSEYSHGMAWNVTAVKDAFIEGGKEMRLTVRPKGALSGGRSYACYSKWDGSAKYVSSYY
jgi:hypothetical protein